jgi:hypothetical protein
MIRDYYLKLDSKEGMPTVLSAFYRQDSTTVVDLETGEETITNVGDPYLVTTTHDYAIDIVGTINKPTGNTLTHEETGFEYPELSPIDGYHINIRLLTDKYVEQVEALSDYLVDPEPVTPSRIWS